MGESKTATVSSATTAFLIQMTAALLLVLGMLFAASPAAAIQKEATLEEIAYAECLAQPYLGFESGASALDCATQKFLKTSAAFKCHLYIDQGYPSAMMERACQLFDSGYRVEFQQGASAAE